LQHLVIALHLAEQRRLRAQKLRTDVHVLVPVMCIEQNTNVAPSLDEASHGARVCRCEPARVDDERGQLSAQGFVHDSIGIHVRSLLEAARLLQRKPSAQSSWPIL
jgi:hypothetical protein